MSTRLTYHTTAILQPYCFCQLIDENGTVIEETNYGPWGRYRNPNTWEYDNTADLSLLHRGYTGHEMLNEFDLIHMNGRMYDPVLGRMLSPDNYVQDPTNPQNYNRYSYCLNNPLKYTDPDGEIPIILPIIGFVAGSYLTGAATNDWDFTPWNGGNGTWNFSDPALYFNMFMGGVAGAALLSTGYGLITGQSAMNLNIGVTMGDALKGGASFLVNNSGIIFQGLGYSTAAGGGAFLTYEMMKGNKIQQQRITVKQAFNHYKFGGGAPLHVDINTIDFSEVSMDDFNEDGLAEVNLDLDPYANYHDAIVHGTIYLQLDDFGNNQASLALNKGMENPELINQRAGMYSFDMKPFNSLNNILRNYITYNAKHINSIHFLQGPYGPFPWYVKGTDFPIYYHGTVNIPN